MFVTTLSEFFRAAVVFIYTYSPLILAIVLVLFALNIIRLHLVARRKRNAMKRRAAAKSQNVNWDMLTKL